MTIHVNIGEAKTRLSQLIAAAERGEEVVIGRAGRPIATLKSVESKEDIIARRKSAFGMFKDKFDRATVDALMAPMTKEELAQWYSPIFPDDKDGAGSERPSA